MSAVILAVTHLVAVALGAWKGPVVVGAVKGILTKHAQSKALSNAQALVAKAKKDADALLAAQALVAAAPAPVVQAAPANPTSGQPA